ncbi:MAG: LPS export ABC transporter permease LptF [Gammaproteobacteria bacterium]
MLIIRRYIYREILHRLLWIAVFLFLIVMTNKLVDYLAEAASGKIPGSFVFRFLWLKMLAVQPEVLPLVLFLAVTLAFSRLNQDNELAVMAAAGIGKKSQLRLVTRFALLFCIIVGFAAFAAAPWAKAEISSLKVKAWQEANISGIVPGKFKELGSGDSVVYVEELSSDKRSMENIFFQSMRDRNSSVLKSASARLEIDRNSGDRFIIFENGSRYQGRPGSLDYKITRYAKYVVLIEPNEEKSGHASAEIISTLTLLSAGPGTQMAELQWRISSVLACLLLALLGVLLNQYPFGQKPFTLMLLGILVYFVYHNLLGISRSLMENEKIPAYLGLWWVHVLLLAIIAATYYFPALMTRRRDGSKTQFLPARP